METPPEILAKILSYLPLFKEQIFIDFDDFRIDFDCYGRKPRLKTRIVIQNPTSIIKELIPISIEKEDDENIHCCLGRSNGNGKFISFVDRIAVVDDISSKILNSPINLHGKHSQGTRRLYPRKIPGILKLLKLMNLFLELPHRNNREELKSDVRAMMQKEFQDDQFFRNI